MLSSLCKLRPLFGRGKLTVDKMMGVETDFKPLKTGLGDNEDVILNFVKLTDNAYTPTRGSNQAAGLDLYSAYECTVPAHGKALVKTDLQIALPSGCYGRIAPRSGLAHKYFIDVGAGVIDADYRGNVGVILFNHGDEDFHVKKGDRIAQLILERIYTCKLVQCKTLSDTDRGMNGFGSTGVN